MRDNQSNIVIEEVIQASMKMTDVPESGTVPARSRSAKTTCHT